MKIQFTAIIVCVSFALGLTSNPAGAIPIAAQLNPIAVYSDLNGAFGLAYDSNRDRMWTLQSPAAGGDGLIHPFKPYKAYTTTERAGFFDLALGLQVISPLAAEEDLGGITPSPASALGYDAALDLLVTQGPLPNNPGSLVAAEPITLNRQDLNYRPGHATPGFLIDGLDIDGSNTWYSPDIENIYRNGSLFASVNNLAQSTLPIWNGLGSPIALGWSGVEQVMNSVFAVAVHASGNVGRTRTLVEFDLAGNLVAFDPDGDTTATRWEDMACDGEFLYAADNFGDANGNGILGDVYVLRGANCNALTSVPEPATLALLSLGLAGIAFSRRKTKKTFHIY